MIEWAWRFAFVCGLLLTVATCGIVVLAFMGWSTP